MSGEIMPSQPAFYHRFIYIDCGVRDNAAISTAWPLQERFVLLSDDSGEDKPSERDARG